VNRTSCKRVCAGLGRAAGTGAAVIGLLHGNRWDVAGGRRQAPVAGPIGLRHQ